MVAHEATVKYTTHVSIGPPGGLGIKVNETYLERTNCAAEFRFDTISGSNEFIVGYAKKAHVFDGTLSSLVGVLEEDKGNTFLGVLIKRPMSTPITQDRLPVVELTKEQMSQLRVVRLPGALLVFVGGSLERSLSVPDDFDLPYVCTIWSDTAISVDFIQRELQISTTRKRTASEFGMAHQLHQKAKFTDAVIKCGGREFSVHRAVLASTSEVFDRMFSSSMREGAEAAVVIEDATPEAVEALIEGMYCGKLPEKRLLPSFWHLASKYLIDDLAAAAMRVMYEEIDISIATDFLLALRHHTQSEEGGSSSEMWSGLLKKLESDKAMHRKVLEELADSSCKRLKRS